MRIFFALEFDKGIKNKIKNQQQIIINNSLKGNFTLEDNFHLTLKYIGEVKETEIGLLKEALVMAASNRNSFNLSIKDLSYFPRGNKKILWLGVTKNEELDSLFKTLDSQLSLIGYEEEERPYTPHITIGREVVLNEDIARLQEQVKICENVTVNKISLMESTRIEGKLAYIPIFTVNLI